MKRRPSRSAIVTSSSKIHLALRYMILSGILFGFSLGIYYASENELWINIFWAVSLVTGVLALTFLIVYLTLIFMRWFRK